MWQVYEDIFCGFFIWLGCFCSYHCSPILFSTCLHIVINHSIICALVNFPSFTLCFWWCYLFCLCGTYSAFFAYAIIIFFWHNIVASLWCWSVDRFIPIVTILMYEFELAVNTIIRKLFVVVIYKPSVSFWIHS